MSTIFIYAFARQQEEKTTKTFKSLANIMNCIYYVHCPVCLCIDRQAV